MNSCFLLMVSKGGKSIDHIIELNKVTKHVCDFFGEQGIFYSEYHGFPSYSKVRGTNYIEIPDGIPISNRAWPVGNGSPGDIADAVHECEKLGRKLLVTDKSQDVVVLSRDFMVEGSTLPVRVGYRVTSPKAKHPKGKRGSFTEALYVKQMHLNRVFLGTLYHLAMGRDYCMAFSESSVVERETKGPTLLEAYQKDHMILNDPKVKKELVRLSLVTYFLSLNDMDNGANVVMDPWGRFDIIDFDKAFWERVPNPWDELVNPFAYKAGHGDSKQLFALPYEKMRRHFTNDEIETMLDEEADKIYLNLKRNINLFHGIIDLMATFEYYNLSANELYGERDVVSYFLRRHHDFMPGINH